MSSTAFPLQTPDYHDVTTTAAAATAAADAAIDVDNCTVDASLAAAETLEAQSIGAVELVAADDADSAANDYQQIDEPAAAAATTTRTLHPLAGSTSLQVTFSNKVDRYGDDCCVLFSFQPHEFTSLGESLLFYFILFIYLFLSILSCPWCLSSTRI